MTFFFDENFPPAIARALNVLQAQKPEEGIKVLNISEEFGKGMADEDWIPKVSERDGIVITQDLNIQRTKQQRDLYREHNLAVIFIKPPSKTGYTYWEQVEEIFSNWSKIKEEMKKAKKPCAFIIRPRSNKIESL